MFARRRHPSHSPDNRETTLLLGLVVLAVVLPTIGFLWFVTKAMKNERAVMREKAKDYYDLQLSTAQRAVNAAIERIAQAESKPLGNANLSEEQRFHRAIEQGLADSLLFLNPDGRLRYPLLAENLDEFDTSEADEKALSLLERWYETDRSEPDTALAVLDDFFQNQCQSGHDFQGRLIYPNLLWAALQRLDPNGAPYSKTLADLRQRLLDSQIPWPITQRLFLTRELLSSGESIDLPSMDAFQLASEILEHPLQLGQPGVLQREPGSAGRWQILTADRKHLLLFREPTIASRLQEAAHRSPDRGEIAFLVSPQSNENAFSTAVGQRAPLWRVSLGAEGIGLPNNAAQQRAYTMAVVCIVLALVGVIGTFAIKRFLAQSRLTQLRTDFISTISHELKTPLASTRMLVDTLVEGKVDDPEKTRSYLEVIGRENTRLSHLVENFLTYSRLESGRMPFDFQPVLPDEIANQALDALENKLEGAAVSLRVHIEADLPYIRADEATLAIALINLLDNAYKYTGDEKEIVLQVRSQGDRVEFSVSDNGIGLTAAERERVRDRFYRVTKHGSSAMTGSGLGLSIVNDIVAAHRGELQIESLPNQGSVFTISLPRAGTR